MEGIALVASAKSEKLGMKQGRNAYVRRTQLENLPDVLLLHILSFLSTKDVVRTSALAKRWQNIWKLVSHIDIEEGEEYIMYPPDSEEESPARVSFMKYVESVLLKRDSSNINKFTLSVCVRRDASRISSWIFAALTHKVQKLRLKLKQIIDKDFELPSCLFTSQFLAQLKIDMTSDLRLPPTIFLPGLEKLQLQDVTFPGDSSTIELFSGCPNLKKLRLLYCDWSRLRAIYISAPRLEKLTIFESYCNPPGAPQVFIFAANLSHLFLSGYLNNDYFVDSPALISVCIDYDFTDDSRNPRELAYRMYRLLWQLAGVKSLSISSESLKVFESAIELLGHLPTFGRLDSLYVIESAINFPSEPLLTILQKSPRLGLLNFAGGFALAEEFEGLPVIDPVPSCFSTHLKIIAISTYSQTAGELNILSQLLRAGSVLEKVYVSCVELRNGADAILTLRRQSRNCKIIISCCLTDVEVSNVD